MSAHGRRVAEFEIEVEPHLEAIHSYALLWTGDAAQAAELTVETVLRAYRSWSEFAAHVPPRTRLLSVVRQLLQSAGAGSPAEPADGGALAGGPAPAPAGDAEEAAADTAARDLSRALRALAPEQRELLFLHLAGFGYAEIAEVAGLSRAAVARRLGAVNDELLKRLLPASTAALALIRQEQQRFVRERAASPGAVPPPEPSL